MITCRTLGPVELSVDAGAAPAELLWRKNLALLVYLARSPRRTRTREHLMGLLWGDRPETAARHSLREAVRVVRRAAGEDGLQTEGEQVRLADGAVALDVDEFVTHADAGRWAAAAELAAGEFLEGFSVPDAAPFEDWLAAERTQWRRRCVDVLVRRAEALARGGAVEPGIACAQRALALDPVADDAARAAMRALALAGDRTLALQTFDAFSARLREAVGASPDEATRRLADQIRRERVVAAPARVTSGLARGAESHRAPLTGREAELGALLGTWDASREGGRAVVLLIDGESGAGRTRLADEFAARARLSGAAVAALRAVPADRARAWSGVCGLAEGGLLGAAGLAGATPGALAAFAARLPGWQAQFPGAARAAPQEFGAALSEVLRAAAEEQPVLLAVDDAQYLDRDSLHALEAAARDLAGLPCAVLLAVATHGVPEELDALRARVGRDVPGTLVHVAPLGPEPLRALARWALPSYTDVQLDRVTRRIATDSAGLPLLAVELLHAVALGLDLHGTPGAWPAEHHTLDQSMPGDLPEAVVAAIRIGFRRLGTDAQAALAALAVLDEPVSTLTAGRATGLAPEPLAAALDELEWERWVSAGARGYGFVARIARLVVARDMLTPGHRERILAAARSAV